MAIFSHCIGVGIQKGSKEELYLNFVIWNKVGQGELTLVEDYRLVFEGDAVQVGKVSVDLTLTVMNAGSTNGTARIAIGGMPPINASYSVAGSKLVFIASK